MQSVPGPSRELFALIGCISAWRGATRELTVRGRDLVLGADVSTVGVAAGAHVIAAGYHDPVTARMIVTVLRLDWAHPEH